jgi:amicyanin
MTGLHVKIAVLAAAVLMLWAAPGLAEDAKIKIANFTFDPPTLTVKAGTTVTWVNADDIPHVVSEKSGTFRSNALDTDETFTQTFPAAGTIEYFCAIHPHMTGKIIVTP